MIFDDNTQMHFVDFVDSHRVQREPDSVETLFSSGDFTEQGIKVTKVQIRLYIEKTDKKLGPYSLLTSFVETEKGSIEMIYDEGFRGNDSLSKAVTFLTSNLGISGLILRSVISLKEHLKDDSS